MYINCNNQSSLICPSNHGRFFTKDALSVWTELGQTFVVRLVMRPKNKDNHNTHYMGADEPSFVVRRSKCITKDISSRCTMCRYTRDANYPSSSGRIMCLKYKKKIVNGVTSISFSGACRGSFLLAECTAWWARYKNIGLEAS